MTPRAATTAADGHAPGRLTLPRLIAALCVPAFALTVIGLADLLPPGNWAAALIAPDPNDPRAVILRYAFAPRVAVALIAGAALGLAGTLLQQALRNPLAEPATLGTFAGASLALSAATLFAPWLLAGGRDFVALGGATVATALAFLLAGRGLSPVRMILGGLVTTLFCNAAAATLVTLKSDDMAALFVWESGSLVQDGGAGVADLALRLGIAAVCAALLMRPLTLLGVGDAAAGSLGARAGAVRLAAVATAVALSASVAAAIGVIAFVGLAAPALARLVGVRSLRGRLVWAPVIGALLLWLTDRLTLVAPFYDEIPAGAATALLGAPLLLVLLPALRPDPPAPAATPASGRDATHLALAVTIVASVAVALVALGLGRDGAGWVWTLPLGGDPLVALRGPRVGAAFGAGALLALAGVALQRMTGNPMAAPEILGVSSGAMLGVLALVLATTGFDRGATLLAAGVGAGAAIAVVLAAARRGAFAPERLLLAGIAVTTMGSGLAAIVLASGDPRVATLHAWIAGSTYGTDAADAWIAMVAAGVGLGALPLAGRWLEALPLGTGTASALGVSLAPARLTLAAAAAAAAAVATLVVGPLSFVGLMAPHMARILGFRRVVPQFVAAALIGGGLLTAADWLGRTVIFPWQIPAGIVSALIGGAYLIARLSFPAGLRKS